MTEEMRGYVEMSGYIAFILVVVAGLWFCLAVLFTETVDEAVEERLDGIQENRPWWLPDAATQPESSVMEWRARRLVRQAKSMVG